MLYNVHLATEKMDDTAMMSDQTRVLLAGCDGLTVDISRLKLALNVRCYNNFSGRHEASNLTFEHCRIAIFLTRISKRKSRKNNGLGRPKLIHKAPSVFGKPERAVESLFLEVFFFYCIFPRSLGCWRRGSASGIGLVGPPGVLVGGGFPRRKSNYYTPRHTVTCRV